MAIAAGFPWVESVDAVAAENAAEIAAAPSLDDAASGTPRGGYSGPGERFAGPSSGGGSSGTTTSTQLDATTASVPESTGLVLIGTVLAYQSASAAGTGVILTSDGLVLTNNHVIESSTAISVTVAGTGETYTATVVGTDVADDVALLQLEGASGGALLDDEGEVVGMTTTGSSGLATTVAYAIPIGDTLAIVDQLLAGDESDGVVIGYPAFLGIAIASESATGTTPGRPSSAVSAAAGAQIAYVYNDTPAAPAGPEAGDTITVIDGTAVASGGELSTAISGYEPGDSVTLTWTDTGGATQSGAVTLIEGPAV